MRTNIGSQRSTFFGAQILAATIQVSTCEKWFHEIAGSPLRWDLFFRPLPLRFVWQWRGRGFVPGPENFGGTE